MCNDKPSGTSPHSPVHPHENGDPVSLIYQLGIRVKVLGTLGPRLRGDERRGR